MIRRAAFWVQKKVPYSMSKYYPDVNGKKYRTDCSGYVSMAWSLSSSLSTVTLPGVSKKISKNDLKAGDILCKCGPNTGGAGGHVLIFEKWVDAAKTKYWAYEQHGNHVTDHRTVPYPYFNDKSYVPRRYNNIQN